MGKSNKNDHVFVYFADHGAKGILGFGGYMLKAHDLQATIRKMHKKKMFSKLVFYVEACESGSMFKGLLKPSMNVFATTASNSTTSSYACYYDPKRGTFLGDVYSIKWLEDSDAEDIEKETLEQQYLRVKKETNTSTVCQFGDMSINKMTVGEFQGLKEAETYRPPVPPSWLSCGRTAVSAPQVPVTVEKRKMEESEDIDAILHDNIELTEFDCYYSAVDAFHSTCFNVGRNDYALRMLNVFVNLCHREVPSSDIVQAIKANCDHPPMFGIY